MKIVVVKRHRAKGSVRSKPPGLRLRCDVNCLTVTGLGNSALERELSGLRVRMLAQRAWFEGAVM